MLVIVAIARLILHFPAKKFFVWTREEGSVLLDALLRPYVSQSRKADWI